MPPPKANFKGRAEVLKRNRAALAGTKRTRSEVDSGTALHVGTGAASAGGSASAGVFGPSIPPNTRVFRPGNKMLLDEALLLLSAQPDFLAQSEKNWITEIIEKHGHIAIFGAKFHPELAAVEYFWGQMKKYLRSHCDYSLETLRTELPNAIASVSVTTIRRYYAHVCRYMKAYSDSTLTLSQVEWSMRKYSSHRRAKEPPADLDEQFLTPKWFEDMPLKLRQL